ncbi:RNA polymerase sigma factor [Caulobacter sp. UNC279MFTsu5.1]|uniref:RNA polymerase sigma factor n=1 Tax=Caulobacter sp. UNC279MFTsu5.1 TaxID=1502775 RepID=UPI0008EBE224|nr:RNA polymerase sigma factor [Caulobacter sp. UNC279MFTsu5.1]SFJ60642.1 RNA polymerase sigma-70 factor, ECF subfamily [Caulobacter sp. UNC279MFTsu5.1]
MDGPLVRAARDGSQSAFARLVAAHERTLRGFLRKSGFGDADDIAQEAFLAAWSSLGRLRDDEGFRAWLYGIAWRKALDHGRSARRAARRDEAWREEQAADAPRGVDPADRLALEAALADLPPDQRACVTLCLGQGWSHGEAAKTLSLPLGTVKSHVNRGRERLLAVLGDAS